MEEKLPKRVYVNRRLAFQRFKRKLGLLFKHWFGW